jgi:mono/diheme cytochrome c family protein
MRYAWPMAVVLAAAPAFAQDKVEARLDASQQLGQHLFNQSCRVCHAKPQLNSAQYGPVLSKDSASGDARAMREVISNGTPRMPGFKHHFQPGEIDAIVAYLKTVPPAGAAPSAPARSSRGGADAD